jgi:hypothetical protein
MGYPLLVSTPPDEPPPSDAPGPASRILWGVVKTVLAGASLFFLALAWVFAEGSTGTFPWRFATATLIVLVVAIAIAARARWMLLVLIGSFAFFFSSCATNFHWG